MHFGQFNLMGYRDRGRPTARILDEAVEQVRVAEQAGFEYAWFAEHHFSNYCVCPSPLMMVARCAGETSSIKLGSAVVVIPLYNAMRLLAEIGMADSLCHGRLALGIGSGYQPYEFERFGADLADSKQMTWEFMEMLELAFTRETFTYRGEHFDIPDTRISARTHGGPPEIWIAGDNPAIHRKAAREGWRPMFTGRTLGADYLATMRARVEESYAEEGVAADAIPLGIQRFLCITDSREEALAYCENARHQARLANNLRNRNEVVDGEMLVEQPVANEPTLEEMAENLPVGDSETVAERLCADIRAAKPTHVMFHVQVGASDQAGALHTIERFATDVRPAIERELGPLDALYPALDAAD